MMKFNIQYFAEPSNGLDILNETEMLNYSRNVELKPYMGDELFPDRKTSSLTAGFVESDSIAPVVAAVHGFDTKTQVGTRDSFSMLEFDKMLIKRQLPIKEEMLEKLAVPRSTEEYQEVVDQIFNRDAYNLMQSVKARCELMKMQLLSTGIVNVDENNVKIALDYQVPASHKVALTEATDKWSDTVNSDPIEDMQTWVDMINEDQGVVPTRALTSTKVLRLIQKNEKVQIAMYGSVQKGKFVSLLELNNLLESMGLPRIAVNDAKYRKQNEDGTYTTERFFPEDKFVMFPEGTLGEGLYGRTPTELRRVLTGHVDVPFGNIYTTVYDTPDPVVTWTKAEGLFAPSFPAYKEVIMATVI